MLSSSWYKAYELSHLERGGGGEGCFQSFEGQAEVLYSPLVLGFR